MKKAATLILFALFISIYAKPNKGQRCRKKYNTGISALNMKHYGRAVGLLSQVRLECIGGIENEDSLYFLLGKAYLGGKKPAEARLEFRTVVEDYPQSQFSEESEYRMGLSSYKAAPIIERESKLYRRAQRELSSFVNHYPSSVYADSAKHILDTIYNKLVEKELLSAHYYEIVDKNESAIIYYKSVLEDYPQTDKTKFIKFKIAWNLVRLSRFTEAEGIIKTLDNEDEFKDDIKNLRKHEEKMKRRIARNEARMKRKRERAAK